MILAGGSAGCQGTTGTRAVGMEKKERAERRRAAVVALLHGWSSPEAVAPGLAPASTISSASASERVPDGVAGAEI